MSFIDLSQVYNFLANTLSNIGNTGSETRLVDSTCLSFVEYDEPSQALTVTFKESGSTYQYSGVDYKTFEQLVQANSVGKYFVADIRNDYPYSRIS